MSVALRSGTDIVSVARIARLVGEERGRERVFGPGEQKRCDAAARPEEEYARLWAVKESVLKALGVGWSGGISWTDVEVTGGGWAYGVRLAGGAARKAEEMGVEHWSVSADSTAELAVATALAMIGETRT